MSKGKTTVGIALRDETVARIDALCAPTATSPRLTRSAYAAWLVERAVAAMPEPGRRTVARSHPEKAATASRALATPSAIPLPREGAKLKAARAVAGLSQPALGALCGGMSRVAVQRAEASATLNAWPALGAWLERQEGARVTHEGGEAKP